MFFYKMHVIVVFSLVFLFSFGYCCSNFEFSCKNGDCIRGIYRCDTDKDCLDGSDEDNCSETICSDDEFRCSSGRCIPKHYECDGEDDCGPHGEDELDCPERKQLNPKPGANNTSLEESITDDIITTPNSCDEGKFRCRNGNCVTASYVCDGDRDCSDGSDEDGCNLCLKPSEIECSVTFRKGGLRDFSSWKCVENNTFRISPGRLIPRTQGPFDDPAVAYVKIICEADFQIDFNFEGVDAMEIFDVARSRKDEKYVISVHSVLAPHTTGSYIFVDSNNESLVNEFFIFVEKETKPYLLGKQRKLDFRIKHKEPQNVSSIILPCISSKVNVPVYLFQREINGTFTRVQNDSYITYDMKRGFELSLEKVFEGFNSSLPNSTIEYICTTDPRNTHDTDVAYISIQYKAIQNLTLQGNLTNNDISSDPELKIVYDSRKNQGATCHSVPYNNNGTVNSPFQFTNHYAKNPIDAKLLIACISKGLHWCGTRPKIQQHNPTKDYVTCKYGSQMSNCQHLSEIYDQGVLICQSGTNILSKIYFIGLDGIPYSEDEWDKVPSSAILRIDANFKSDEILSETDYHVKCPGIDMILDRNPNVEIIYRDNATQKKTTFSASTYVSLKVGATDIACQDSVWKSNQTVKAVLHLNVTVKPKPCSYLQFTCENGQCIRYSYRCDRDRDCTDGSDEMNCSYPTTTTTTPAPCSSNEFKCNSGICIRASYRCDGDNDCRYGEDEQDCPSTEAPTPTSTTPRSDSCSDGQYRCKNGDCIRMTYICDHERDCKDGSDEDPKICGNRTTTTMRPSSTTITATTHFANVANISDETTTSTTTTPTTTAKQEEEHKESQPKIIIRQHKVAESHNSSSTSGGMIAGVIIGVLLVVFILCGIVLAYYKYKTGSRRGNDSSGTNIKYTNPLFESDTAITVT